MATSSKTAAKPGPAKAPKAAATPVDKVATPKVDEAAAKAALSNQGSGDGNTTTATNGVHGEGAAPAAAPNTAGEGAAPAAAPNTAGEGAAPAAAPTTAGEGTAPTAAPTTAGEGAAPADAPGATSDAPEISDRAIDESQPPIDLSRTLYNHTPSEIRLPLLDVILAPGTSQVVHFKDEAHKAACEEQISQLKELTAHTKTCDLHWDACQ